MAQQRPENTEDESQHDSDEDASKYQERQWRRAQNERQECRCQNRRDEHRHYQQADRSCGGATEHVVQVDIPDQERRRGKGGLGTNDDSHGKREQWGAQVSRLRIVASEGC